MASKNRIDSVLLSIAWAYNESRLEMKVEIILEVMGVYSERDSTTSSGSPRCSSNHFVFLVLFSFFLLTAHKCLLHEVTIVITNHQVFEALLNPAVLKDGRRNEYWGDWEIECWVVEDTLAALAKATHPQAFSVINHQQTHLYKERDPISICS